jgi:hypothetical protein
VRTSPFFEKAPTPTRHKHKVTHAAVRPGGLTAHCVQSTPVCKSTITWCWYSTIWRSCGCQSSVARALAPGQTRQGSHCWAVARKRKKAPTQCSRRHTLQFALAGSLHAVCNLRLFLRDLQALARSVALPSLCGMGGLRGGGSWRAPEFWAGKSCTFRKSRKDFQNKHVHPPSTTSLERNRFVSIFRAISKNGCLC